MQGAADNILAVTVHKVAPALARVEDFPRCWMPARMKRGAGDARGHPGNIMYRVPVISVIHETKAQRNHLFHGMWGWAGDDQTKRMFPAARKYPVVHAPFPASSLSTLEKKLCKASRMGFELFTTYMGSRVPVHPSRFFHHNAGLEVPEWLEQWRQGNPWDDGDPDRIEKAGQLPRRSSLCPQR